MIKPIAEGGDVFTRTRADRAKHGNSRSTNTSDVDAVADALIKEIDSIRSTDFGEATRARLVQHWSDDGLASSIEGFLKRRKHGRMMDFSESAARFFEELAARNPLGRKGQPYSMRLRQVMKRAAISRSIATIAEHSDVNNRMIRYSKVSASSIRLVGADNERFDRSDIVLRRRPTSRYLVPPEIQSSSESRLRRLKALNQEREVPFVNGEVARITAFSFDYPDPVTEQKRIILEWEPMFWFDYSVVQDYVSECRINGMQAELDALIDVAEVGAGTMRRTRLPNLAPIGLTLVTSDNFMLYVRRDAVAASPGWLSTSVSENIHIEKDKDRSGSIQIYQTAERGIVEELSPSITSRANKVKLSLLGMAFSLDELECPFLFLGEIAATRAEVQAMCELHPGKDYKESRCKWASFGDGGTELSELLAREDWTCQGKASIIRALEYLKSCRLNTPN